jgi:hypothetical protein
MTDDAIYRLLNIIAETFDSNAAIMQAAAKYAGADGRTLVSDHAEGARDAFQVAADFVREIAVAPAESRGQIASRVTLVPDPADAVRGQRTEVL